MGPFKLGKSGQERDFLDVSHSDLNPEKSYMLAKVEREENVWFCFLRKTQEDSEIAHENILGGPVPNKIK